MSAPYAMPNMLQQPAPASQLRSMTPATHNLRTPQLPHQQRYASAPRMGGPLRSNDPYGMPHNNNGMMNNPNMQQQQQQPPQRSMTPNRMGVYHRPEGGGVVDGNSFWNNNNSNGPNGPQPLQHAALSPANQQQQPQQQNGPTSSGLIRLTLKKPMGIVFEPMYDPHQPSAQRGVRICDLPRTGAAALSRKLQVGDELLQINEKTVSRLTFDEIMDFIIDADPEAVHLLFRRPRKATLGSVNAPGVKDPTSSKIKWQDMDAAGTAGEATKATDSVPAQQQPPSAQDSEKKKEKKSKRSEHRHKKKRDRKGPNRSKKSNRDFDDTTLEEETLQSGDQDSYVPKNSKRYRKKNGSNKPYESEGFLDLLIDTICSNPNNVCRDGLMMNPKEEDMDDLDDLEEDYDLSDEDDEDDEEEEESRGENDEESTYVTYEESMDDARHKSHKKKDKEKTFKKSKELLPDRFDEQDDEEEEEEENIAAPDARREPIKRKEKSPHNEKNERKSTSNGRPSFGGDGEKDRTPKVSTPLQSPSTPNGLHNLPPNPTPRGANDAPDDDATNPNAPIREVEYDDRFDHGADVSVMESLGGPSLLIEKQRALHMPAAAKVPPELLQTYGSEYPTEFGKTREETVAADPLRFYTFVVKSLLEQHEPEKVRLLDKLLAKYKGREDHLVQKLSVRYNRPGDVEEEAAPAEATSRHDDPPEHEPAQDTYNNNVSSSNNNTTTPSGGGGFFASWPEKEEKQDDDDAVPASPRKVTPQDDEALEESGSEYSHEDSVDGTSPAVIAQVSELLNYVYGKTSVPGQIDRVSTIMRAYEGREAVLLELLETKALIKANKEKENADELPAFLRNSPQMLQKSSLDEDETDDPPPSNDPPLSHHHAQEPPGETDATTPSGANNNHHTLIRDDISSMSGVSSPVAEQATAQQQQPPSYNAFYLPPMDEEEPESFFGSPKNRSSPRKDPQSLTPSNKQQQSSKMSSSNNNNMTPTPDKKKKKGIFGGLFSGKKKGTPARSGSRLRKTG